MSSSPLPPRVVVPPEIEWDDELWDLTWERRLDQQERHSLGWTVLRGRLPDADPFVAAVGRELALRWRRTLRNRAWLWGTWTAFWLMCVVAVVPEPWGVPASMVVVGLCAIVAFLWVRRRMALVVWEADRRIRWARAQQTEQPRDDDAPPALGEAA